MNTNENCEYVEDNCAKTEEYFSSDSNSTTKFDDQLSIIENKLVEMPDVWEYIQSLRKFIKKQQKKLKKLSRKIRRREAKEISTQTECIENTTNSTVAPKTITEEIKEAAETALQNQGFVYEETSGLYYDYNSGYYYNAEYGLYYDGNTGTYMSYDQEKQKYIFHSQVQVKPKEETFADCDMKRKQEKSQERKRKRNVCSEVEQDKEMEEGECSDDSSQVSDSESGNSADIVDDNDDQNSESSKQWPPCIRIIVEETSIPTVKTGSLFVITYVGGTLGREGKHDILLRDINVSKHHLKFTYDKDADKYFVTDLGSRNGTLFNGKRMASSKQESEPTEIVHGSRIQIGSTVLLCHIHAGSQTCGLCEPGLLQQKETQGYWTGKKTDKSAEHKHQLRKLKKKFAVDSSGDTSLAHGYTDRAQARRDTVGSHNEHEKTQVASLEQSISAENKGFKLLAKMGWKEGQSLGKDGTGLVEPVALVSNHGTSGMGSKDVAFQQPQQTHKSAKDDIWTKTRERYDQLESNSDIFKDSDSD